MGSRRSCGWLLLIDAGEADCVSTPLARKSIGSPAYRNSLYSTGATGGDVRTGDKAWRAFLAELKVWCESEEAGKFAEH